jgi:type II secretory pathway pseudopilin PulG
MKKSKFKNITAGVSLIELIIVIFILAIICYAGVTAFARFRRTAALDSAKQEVLTALSEARELTLSSNNAKVYGVHFQTDKAVRFSGPTYSAGASDNVPNIYDAKVRVTGINLTNGVSDVVFIRLSGGSSATGTIVLSPYGANNQFATTSITGGGIIQ